jgi:hydrogenase nickel incorporation protein HypA/HybF
LHELSIAQDILQAVLSEAQKAGGKRIEGIHVKARESIHHMEDYSLETCLEAIAKGTIAEGVKIEIELIPPTLRCKECDFTFLAQGSTLLCPRCRSGKLEELDAEKIDLECNFAE